MALPQKIVEELGRGTPQVTGWFSQLIMFSSTIFLISLFVYVGIIYGYEPYLNSQAQKLNDAVQAFAQQVPVEKQAQIISFYSQIVNLKSILGKHVYFSSFLSWLESNTETNVFFSGLSADTDRGSVSLSGFARTLNDFDAQAAVFSSRPEVTKESLGNVSFVNGLWQFDLTLYFSPDFFREPPSE